MIGMSKKKKVSKTWPREQDYDLHEPCTFEKDVKIPSNLVKMLDYVIWRAETDSKTSHLTFGLADNGFINYEGLVPQYVEIYNFVRKNNGSK